MGEHRNGCLTVCAGGRSRPGKLAAAGQDEWIRAMRPVTVTPVEWGIVRELAGYANKKDGKNARPGNERLAWATGAAVITVRRTLDKLQQWFVIHCNECGNGRGHARTWQLCLPDDFETRVPQMEFEQWREIRA